MDCPSFFHPSDKQGGRSCGWTGRNNAFCKRKISSASPWHMTSTGASEMEPIFYTFGLENAVDLRDILRGGNCRPPFPGSIAERNGRPQGSFCLDSCHGGGRVDFQLPSVPGVTLQCQLGDPCHGAPAEGFTWISTAKNHRYILK